MRQSGMGQSLSEYGLIAALIGLCAVAALTSLSGQIQNGFMSILPTADRSQQIGLQASTSSLSEQAGELGALSSVKDKFSGILDKSLMNNPQAMAEPVRTTGANGTSEILADRIAQFAKQWLDSGEITQEQADQFQKLANQGHRIAQIERLIENAVDAGDDSILFEGKMYSPHTLSLKIGWKGSYGRANQDVAHQELQTFMTALEALEQTGAFGNPEIKAKVTQWSSEIAILSETLENAVRDRNKTSAPLRDVMVSELSHDKSGRICKAGDRQDNGRHCQ